MFRVKKRYFIVGIVFFSLFLILSLASIFLLKKSLCDSEKLLSPCGLTSSTTGDVKIITGVLVNKYKKENRFYFQMVTRDKNQKSYTFTFTNPPNFPLMVIDKIPLPTGRGTRTDMLGRTLPINDFYNFVNPRMPLRVFIYNPKKLLELQGTKIPENLRKCIPYQVSLFEYLENPSLKANVLSRYLSLKDNCQMTLASVGI